MVTSTNRSHSLTGTRGLGVTLHIVRSGKQDLELRAIADATKFVAENFGVEEVEGMTVREIMECYVTL